MAKIQKYPIKTNEMEFIFGGIQSTPLSSDTLVYHLFIVIDF